MTAAAVSPLPPCRAALIDTIKSFQSAQSFITAGAAQSSALLRPATESDIVAAAAGIIRRQEGGPIIPTLYLVRDFVAINVSPASRVRRINSYLPAICLPKFPATIQQIPSIDPIKPVDKLFSGSCYLCRKQHRLSSQLSDRVSSDLPASHTRRALNE